MTQINSDVNFIAMKIFQSAASRRPAPFIREASIFYPDELQRVLLHKHLEMELYHGW